MRIKPPSYLTKKVVKGLLEGFIKTYNHNWSLQGLGMLRLNITRELRLHIWDSRFKTPGVSTIHTHPWDLTSCILAGTLIQNRFVASEDFEQLSNSVFDFKLYNRIKLKCGPKGAEKQTEISAPERVCLHRYPDEVFEEGDAYSQTASEIHESFPEDGTITLVHKQYDPARDDSAYVFYPAGGRWGDANHYSPSSDIVRDIVAASLHKWFV